MPNKLIIGAVVILIISLTILNYNISTAIEKEGGFKEVAKTFVIDAKEVLNAEKG